MIIHGSDWFIQVPNPVTGRAGSPISILTGSDSDLFPDHSPS